jgi:hypothetical protein
VSALVAAGIGLCAAPAAFGATLYNQLGAFTGSTASSQYDPPSDNITQQAADDFVVPPGKSWTIDRVDVLGVPGPGGSPSVVNLFFYADGGGIPGAPLFTALGIATSGGPNYGVHPAQPPTLTPGRYWVSVQAVGAHFTPTAVNWSWGTRVPITGSQFATQNPGGAFRPLCPTWEPDTTCNATDTPADLLFLLGGTEQAYPANTFSFGKVKRHRKKGTATLPVIVPGAGTVAMAGKGVKSRLAGDQSSATRGVSAPAAGTVNLTVKATGKKKARLSQRHKTTVTPIVTFTPTGGTATTRSQPLKLVKRG